MIKTLADLVTDIIAIEGCGELGKDLFTGSFDEKTHKCQCNKCDFCIKGCLTYVAQGNSTFGQCYSDIDSSITITCRSSYGTNQNEAFSKLVSIKNTLSKYSSYDGYKLDFKHGLGSINTARDSGGRIIFYLNISCLYTKIS